jgi:hypothetical protein
VESGGQHVSHLVHRLGHVPADKAQPFALGLPERFFEADDYLFVHTGIQHVDNCEVAGGKGRDEANGGGLKDSQGQIRYDLFPR